MSVPLLLIQMTTTAAPVFKAAWAKSANAITGPTMPVGTVIE